MMKKIKHTYPFYIPLLLLLLWQGFWGMQAMAQNNPYKIDDACYEYFYKRLSPQLNNPRGILMCDTFKIMAKQAGDQKSLCMYYNLKGRAYRHQKKEDELRRLVKEAEVCLQTPYKQYYWSTAMLLCSLIEQEHGVDDCQQFLETMAKQAEALNDNYGRSSIYRKMSTIYYNYQNYQQSLNCLSRAVKAMRADGNTNNIYSLENDMATTLGAMSRIQEADSLYEESTKHAPRSLAFTIWGNRLINMFTRESKDSLLIERLYHSMEQSRKEFKGDISIYDHTLYNAKTCYFIFKGQLDSIKVYLNLLEKASQRNPMIYSSKLQAARYYLLKKDADSVYLAMLDYVRFRNTQWQKSNTDAIGRMESTTGKLRVESQNKQLLIDQLESQHRLLQMQSDQNLLKLRYGNLELQQRDAQLLARSREVQLHRAETNKQKEEARHQRELNKQSEARAKAQQQSARAVRLLLFAVSTCAILIITVLLISQRKVNKKRHEAERLQKEAEEARRQAERADELKTLFLQNMSHEIRTPLNAIVGFNEILNGDAANDISMEEKHEFTSLISTNATLLTTLVNDILDLSKLESGTYRLALSEVSAQALCTNALSSVKGRESDGVTMQFTAPDKAITELQLYTDAVRVQQVLINYLTNACKNTTAGSITLTYQTKQQNDNELWVSFSVTDTGCGVPPNKAADIFKRFEKLDNFKQGTGLGLNICTRIADLLHGRVYLDNDYQTGARFVFEFPARYK